MGAAARKILNPNKEELKVFNENLEKIEEGKLSLAQAEKIIVANVNAFNSFIEDNVFKTESNIYETLSSERKQEVNEEIKLWNVNWLHTYALGKSVGGTAKEVVENMNQLVGRVGEATNMAATFEAELNPLKVEQDGSVSQDAMKATMTSNHDIITKELKDKFGFSYNDNELKDHLLKLGVEQINNNESNSLGVVQANPLFEVLFGSYVAPVENTDVNVANVAPEQKTEQKESDEKVAEPVQDQLQEEEDLGLDDMGSDEKLPNEPKVKTEIELIVPKEMAKLTGVDINSNQPNLERQKQTTKLPNPSKSKEKAEATTKNIENKGAHISTTASKEAKDVDAVESRISNRINNALNEIKKKYNSPEFPMPTYEFIATGIKAEIKNENPKISEAEFYKKYKEKLSKYLSEDIKDQELIITNEMSKYKAMDLIEKDQNTLAHLYSNHHKKLTEAMGYKYLSSEDLLNQQIPTLNRLATNSRAYLNLYKEIFGENLPTNSKYIHRYDDGKLDLDNSKFLSLLDEKTEEAKKKYGDAYYYELLSSDIASEAMAAKDALSSLKITNESEKDQLIKEYDASLNTFSTITLEFLDELKNKKDAGEYAPKLSSKSLLEALNTLQKEYSRVEQLDHASIQKQKLAFDMAVKAEATTNDKQVEGRVGNWRKNRDIKKASIATTNLQNDLDFAKSKYALHTLAFHAVEDALFRNGRGINDSFNVKYIPEFSNKT